MLPLNPQGIALPEKTVSTQEFTMIENNNPSPIQTNPVVEPGTGNSRQSSQESTNSANGVGLLTEEYLFPTEPVQFSLKQGNQNVVVKVVVHADPTWQDVVGNVALSAALHLKTVLTPENFNKLAEYAFNELEAERARVLKADPAISERIPPFVRDSADLFFSGYELYRELKEIG